MKNTNNIKENTMRKRYEYKPTGSQLNPGVLNTEKVQLWKNGIMITLVLLDTAKKMVAEGTAFVITSQAIGYMYNGKSEA